jgi:hypothetical protein
MVAISEELVLPLEMSVQSCYYQHESSFCFVLLFLSQLFIQHFSE